MAKVDVSVTVTSGSVACNPELLDLSDKPKDTAIKFQLTSTGYAFPELSPYGIQIDAGEGQFIDYRRKDDHTVTLVAVNDDGQTHSYTVSVVDTTNGQTLSSDPAIKDRGG
jgi:hypothetical protein